MSKTIRKFSKKGKKTQQRRKTKGKKYGGDDGDCNVGEQIHECKLQGEPVNNEHRVQLVNCFNSIAKTNFTEDTNDTDLKKAYRKAVVKLHPDKVKGEAEKETAEKETAKLNNAYNGLTECKVQETVRPQYDDGSDSDEDDPEMKQQSSNQNQKLGIINALMKKIYGDECDKKHPEPTGFFGAKLKHDDPKIGIRNHNIIKCDNINRTKVREYLNKREEMKNPILTVNDAINVKELEFYNILCIGKADDSNECKKLASLMDKIGGKGKSKKSTRKTKKEKYSKRK